MKESIKNKFQEIYFKIFSIKGAPIKPRLLPSYFKKVGIAIIVLSVIFRFTPTYHDLTKHFKILLEDVLILGLFFIAIAKDKEDDEMVEIIRYKAMAYAFSFAVAFFLLMEVAFLFLEITSIETDARVLIFITLITYLIIYFNQKQELKCKI